MKHEHRARPGPRGYVAIIGTFLLAFLLAVGAGGAGESAFAATPPTVEQCNGILNATAQQIECSVDVANTYNIGTGIGSSVVTVTVCTGPSGAPVCGGAVTTNCPAVITSVLQCNDSGNAGGSIIICTVSIANMITGSTAVTAGTVNQCIGSGEGGGATPLNCGPPQSTSGATLTQCNGSGNNGGATLRVTCSFGALTETAALRVTINQCNGSANGGGDLVTCSATETNTVVPAAGTPPGPVPDSPRDLAYTGFNGWPFAIYGTILVILGALLMVRSGGRITEEAPID